MFDSVQPQKEPLPLGWDKKLSSFEKMIVLKAIRIDKVLPAI
jgi:dynein heavy chain